MASPQRVVFVYSGKGGVGKSTVAVNLAFKLAKRGFSIGLFDADLYGPSLPTLVSGLRVDRPIQMRSHAIEPALIHGVLVGSVGFIGNDATGHFWAGEYLEGVLHQLLYSPAWPVDCLIIDMPPGAGELHHRLFSQVQGQTLLVTTPQNVSYVDTLKGIEMLRRLQVGVLGVVENMGRYVCNTCGAEQHFFADDTWRVLCEPFGYPLLETLPFVPVVSRDASRVPHVITLTESPLSEAMGRLADAVLSRYDQAGVNWPTV